MKPYAFRHQPLKVLYLTYQLLSTVFVRIPYWLLTALPRSLRPRKSWTIKRTVMIHIVRHLFNATALSGPVVKIPTHKELVLTKGAMGVWVDPLPAALLRGSIETRARSANVSPIRVPGYWIHSKESDIPMGAPPKKGEKVLYNIHGGAFIRCSAHPGDPTANIPKKIVKHVDCINRALSIEYRLSSHRPYKEEGAFPAAILDALSGYNYLVKVVGFSPSDIVVVGDSAGGSLAQALTRYLVENQGTPDLPSPPDALILLSPWADVGNSVSGPTSSIHKFASSDYIIINPSQGPGYAQLAYTGPHGMAITNFDPYVSPGSLHPSMSKVTFKGFPRTFIVAGGAEVLYDQIVVLKDRMVKDMGEDNVVFYEAPDAFHDYFVFDVGEPETGETVKAINEWI